MSNPQLDDYTLNRMHLASVTPDIEVLRELSKDQCCDVRACAADNDYADEEILTRLSRDRDVFVRKKVARCWGSCYRVANDSEHIILAFFPFITIPCN
jgi:hypothetical protein